MPTSALLLALAAAVVHACWNVLLSGSDDTYSATAVAIVVGVIAFAPVAALTWRVQQSALPYIAASSALELLYLVLLASGYARSAMSFVYPIARGSAPVIVLLVSVVALGSSVAPLAAAGVVLIALGVLLVRGLRSSGSMRELSLALAVGACIASYTLVDKHGIAHADPLSYLELVFTLTAAGYVVGALRLRGAAALRAAVRFSSILAGIGFFAAYALALAALRLAPAASVASVRESSVVLGTAWLAFSGREWVTRERLAGALAVVAGVALISLA
jgi:drug/metabolite transporter (DMT)-like permease